MIAIVDYGAGNVQSVKNALDLLGVLSVITDDRETILKADKVIFPGQGHFGSAVQALREKGLFDAIRTSALTKPFLGICVGMQLLFEKSEEAEGVAGLAVLKGEVKKFRCGQKLPQMGWNRVQDRFYYFANSYHCVPEEKQCIAAEGFYGEPFVAVLRKGNLLAVQFHPEKSGADGKLLLERFARGDALTKRIIPCLDVKGGQVVKGKRFVDLQQAGDPVAMAAFYESQGADELVLLDIAASIEGRAAFPDVVERVAQTLSIPFAVGGGIGSLAEIRCLLHAGADKVSLNSAALQNPQLIQEASDAFGSQCIVLSIDVKKVGARWEVFSHGGTVATGKEALLWALEGESLGAGELLVTSIDRDGTQEGYDLELMKMLSRHSSIPLIASGGASKWEDIKEAFTEGGADAALAASLFHFQGCSVRELKQRLAREGIRVRL